MQFKDCYYTFDENLLIVGNSQIERTWDLSSDVPVCLSLVNKHQKDEWVDQKRKVPMCRSSLIPFSKNPTYCVFAQVDHDMGIATEHLHITVEYVYQNSQLKLDILVFPEKPFIKHVVWYKRKSNGETAGYLPPSSFQNQLDKNSHQNQENNELQDYLDFFPLKDLHCSWKSVAFRDVTDRNNNLVDETKGLLYRNERRVVEGNLLILNKTLKNSGLILLKEGPTPLAYLNETKGDFLFNGTDIYMVGSGIQEKDVESDHYLKTYSCVVGVYDGTETNMVNVLNQYDQATYQYNESRDYFVMCNTWGDRSKDGRICESFILNELPLAAKLGITTYQIDDGWQTGITSNSVKPGGKWSDYYANDEAFWSVNKERFPNGLEPIVDLARRENINLGLWFSPDSAYHFRNWEKDADQLIELYETYHISYFKLDGVHFQSKVGEMNFTKLLEKVTQHTSRAVTFNLDTTAQVRSGYFGLTGLGTIFLENRYTDFQSYYPHWTLRNLWQLSKYIPAQKLQMEFLNVNRNQDRYGDDPLSPATCGIAYAFAVTMFSNPLAWMEVTGLSGKGQETLGKLIREYRHYQKDILSGHILPIGEEPSGVSWTGFQSIKNEKEGYLMVFKELNGSEKGDFTLWNPTGEVVNLECLIQKQGSKGEVETSADFTDSKSILRRNENGAFSFYCNEPFSFKLYKYSFS